MSEIALNEGEEKLLEQLFDKGISPNPFGRYVGLEGLTGKKPEEVSSLVQSLASRGLLSVETIERYNACPSCEGISFLTQVICPTCKSSNLLNSNVKEYGIYSHKRDSCIFEVERPEKGRVPFCSRCNQEVEKDYRRPGSWLKCDKGHKFPRAEPKFTKNTCSNPDCGKEFLFDEAASKTVTSYVLSEMAKEFLASRMADISPLLNECGYNNVERGPITVEGGGGAKYVLEKGDIMGRKEGDMIIVRTKVDLEQSGYLAFITLTKGVNAGHAYFLARNCSGLEIISKLAEFYKIPVIVNPDKNELYRKFGEKLSGDLGIKFIPKGP